MDINILYELALEIAGKLTSNLKTELEIQHTLELVSKLIAVKDTIQQ